MLYRRFGRTELPMPVLSCGGMRYQQAWKDLTRDEITDESQANVEACIRAALALGINHIETARGYGCSELQLGGILPTLPREQLIVQTKVGPHETGDDFRRTFETSMERLQLDHVDLLAIHGINNQELVELSTKPGGSLEMCWKLRDEGLCRHVGFSTHGPCDAIVAAIETGGFEYVNLHYYWADQANAPAVAAAAARDMGVFIISPSEKGGLLWKPPAKLVELCAPLPPLVFSHLWTLAHAAVHTLSVGVARPEEFDAHMEVFDWWERAAELLPPITERLEAELVRAMGRKWAEGWSVGLPDTDHTPGTVNLYHVLRLFTLAKAFDMVEYGRMRYNLFGNGGHWFYGNKVDKIEWDALPGALSASPVAAHIPAALREAHELLDAEAKKRLSESEG
jgi:predicted aldo/keto reductase-like oxidoreductase